MRAIAFVFGCLLVVLGAATTQAAREYRIVMGHDISGYDIPAKDGKAFTKVCVPSGGYKGKYGYDAYKLICDETPKCVAVTAPAAPDGCAYLKTKGTRDVIRADPKWVTVTSQEKPQKPCSTYSPIGGPCTSDVWADQPLCCGGNHIACVNNKCASSFPGRRMMA